MYLDPRYTPNKVRAFVKICLTKYMLVQNSFGNFLKNSYSFILCRGL